MSSTVATSDDSLPGGTGANSSLRSTTNVPAMLFDTEYASNRVTTGPVLRFISILFALLNSSLEPYFPQNVGQFLRVLDYCHGAISGSWALWFILQPSWKPKDMDIVIPFGKEYPFEMLTRFLLMCGYLQSRVFNGGSMTGGGFRMISKVATWTNADLGTSIDILVSVSDTVVDVISGFHSSIPMNFITSKHIVVMHPIQTFSSVSLFQGRISRKVRRKYEERGIRFIRSNAEAAGPCGRGCPSLVRGAFRPGTYLSVPIDARYLLVESPLIPFWSPWSAPFKCENAKCVNCGLRVQDVKTDDDTSHTSSTSPGPSDDDVLAQMDDMDDADSTGVNDDLDGDEFTGSHDSDDLEEGSEDSVGSDSSDPIDTADVSGSPTDSLDA